MTATFPETTTPALAVGPAAAQKSLRRLSVAVALVGALGIAGGIASIADLPSGPLTFMAYFNVAQIVAGSFALIGSYFIRRGRHAKLSEAACALTAIACPAVIGLVVLAWGNRVFKRPAVKAVFQANTSLA